jgi:hypothetical protein
MIGFSIAPVIGQSSSLYTVHVDFVSYSCSLAEVRVSLYDQSGHFVAAASSPLGTEVAVSFRPSSPPNSLTARADGVASYGSYYSWGVSGVGKVDVGSGGDYWILIRMS